VQPVCLLSDHPRNTIAPLKQFRLRLDGSTSLRDW
jgi:hypothetical protein